MKGLHDLDSKRCGMLTKAIPFKIGVMIGTLQPSQNRNISDRINKETFRKNGGLPSKQANNAISSLMEVGTRMGRR